MEKDENNDGVLTKEEVGVGKHATRMSIQMTQSDENVNIMIKDEL
ncbi:unnamed protein product [Dibothriocephalus latus]|uniref:EF-hand domain-containing protein n=1 Tax=Dibothriocephalus latus TaxID=60516 RepID=A0A3P6QGD0_DIBLA|nr:unnamed protein product [Dibothriocephalus latus]